MSVMNILAVSPWIHDFAAYDFWLKPYGFLVLLTYLTQRGFHIDYIDCLNKRETFDNFGRGKYFSEIISKPEIFRLIPRHFKRYGMTPDEFEKHLTGLNPDYILITSSMTYWYRGLKEAEQILKRRFPDVPMIVGGTYATLMYEHAKQSCLSQHIVTNENLASLFKLLGVKFNKEEFYSTLPEYERFYPALDYVVLRTSWGCPFSCSYCAIKKLHSDFFRLSHEKVLNFILKYHRNRMQDFVLYDDAFLYPPQDAYTLLRKIESLSLPLHFHTPNALHLRFINKKIATLLKKVGFINPHFGLETLNPRLQKKWGDKINTEDLMKGIDFLKKGGFGAGEFSVYLLLGYPGQNLEKLKEEVEFLHSLGAKVSLAEFSPVPETEIYNRYKSKIKEPLLHNNSVFNFFDNELKDFYEVKRYVRNLNKKFVT